MVYRRPPLIEVTIDVRWVVGPSPTQVAPSASPSLIVGSAQDDVFERLQAGLAKHGFPRSERLVPIGLPLPAYQVFYRWKREEPFSTVVSAGPGLLAVSARPPYEGWSHFAAAARWLPDVLFDSLPEEDRQRSLSRMSVIYLNAFDEVLRQGRTPADFTRDVLGFNVVLPPAYAPFGQWNRAEQFSLSVELSTDQNMVLSASAAQAMHAGAPVALLSLSAHTADGDVISHPHVLPRLDALHAQLDGLFHQMTAGIQELMEPVGSDEAGDA